MHYYKWKTKVKTTINTLKDKKGKEPITLLTCYDYYTASVMNQTEIDAILVGDSLGMVFKGDENTLSVTLDEIIYHTKAVKRGAYNKFIISDMPFLSYKISVKDTIRNAGKIIKESSADAVKMEGGVEICKEIKALVNADIPVCGHLGLTPQAIKLFGGNRVQGKSYEKAKEILDSAIALEEAGAFAIVLECIPQDLAKLITEKISIPTIGIGAGVYTDGQVLVINDILGTYNRPSPKFSKKFSNVDNETKNGIEAYIRDVKSRAFPSESNIFTSIDKDVIDKLRNSKEV
jgi:3-methyl-2-oxobutanoate hydroxymethyltransferase